MSVKAKIVIFIAVAAFLGALVMLVSFCLKLSGFIDSNIANELDRAVLEVSNEIETIKLETHTAALYREFAERLKNITGCEITIFTDSVCIATTLQNGSATLRDTDVLITEDASRMVRTDTGNRIRIGRHNLQAKYIPLMDADGHTTGMIVVGYLLARKTASLWSFLIMGIIVAVAFPFIIVPLGLVVAGRVSEPVDKMLDNAHYDILTGVYNRRYVDENLKNLIGFLSRSGGSLSLLMIDIDHFKEYNEKYGYGVGDNCLKIVANVLNKGISRSEDFTARYGGKEFVVVLPNTDENGACIIAEKLLATIRECRIPHEKNDPAGCVTVSIGVAMGKIDHLQSGDDYIKHANEMMHQSVREGCNRYSFTKL